jgi:hypothetical protein
VNWPVRDARVARDPEDQLTRTIPEMPPRPLSNESIRSRVTALDLVEHPIDVRLRRRRLQSISRVDSRKSRGHVRAGAGGRAFPKMSTDPFGCSQIVPAREPLDRPKLGIIKQDLQTLGHAMSVPRPSIASLTIR